MKQDIISNTLNQIMNAKKMRKNELIVATHSKSLLNILNIAKEHGYIEEYKIEKYGLKIHIGNLNECKVIKPRFNINKKNIDKYIKRYLPARGMGIIIVSTNKGFMTHMDSIDKGLGGCLIAYFF